MNRFGQTASVLLAALPLCLTTAVLTSCYDCGEREIIQPDITKNYGAVVVTTDWSGRDDSADIPQSYILRINDTEQVVCGETNLLETMPAPGDHGLTVFNIPEGITVRGNIATVNSAADMTRATEQIVPQPGYLFASHRTITVTAEDTLRVTATMKQYVRRLDIELTTTGISGVHVTAGTATLSGVATGVDITTGELVGTTAQASTALTTEGNKSTLSFMVLGVTPSVEQTLTVGIVLSNGETQTIVSDITEPLDGINGRTEPTKLTGDMEVKPVGGVMTATITGWQAGNGDGEDVGIK